MQDFSGLIHPVVLAAGLSRRMGTNKLLIPIHGKPMLRWAVDALLDSGFNCVTVVTGFDADTVGAALSGYVNQVDLVFNPDFEQGRATSVKAALMRVAQTGRSMLVTPGDVPFITPNLVRALCAEFIRQGKIIFPMVDGKKGHPVVFPTSSFDMLRDLTGDKTLHDYLLSSPQSASPLIWTDHGCIKDLDTPESIAGL